MEMCGGALWWNCVELCGRALVELCGGAVWWSSSGTV